jgi:hypothetical protein
MSSPSFSGPNLNPNWQLMGKYTEAQKCKVGSNWIRFSGMNTKMKMWCHLKDYEVIEPRWWKALFFKLNNLFSFYSSKILLTCIWRENTCQWQNDWREIWNSLRKIFLWQ